MVKVKLRQWLKHHLKFSLGFLKFGSGLSPSDNQFVPCKVTNRIDPYKRSLVSRKETIVTNEIKKV